MINFGNNFTDALQKAISLSDTLKCGYFVLLIDGELEVQKTQKETNKATLLAFCTDGVVNYEMTNARQIYKLI